MFWRFLAVLVVSAAVAGQAPASARQLGPEAVPELATPAPAPWRVVSEVVKQSAEQPLHFAMAAAPIWLSRCLTAVPWYGWAAVPALAYREWQQWPSKRWWDPLLDAGFLLLGVLAATWKLRPLPFWPWPVLPLPWPRRPGTAARRIKAMALLDRA